MAFSSDKDPFRYEEEKREFIDGLRQFHLGRGTPFDKIPRLGSREVDLYQLYQRVTSLGGWLKVTEEQRWEEILLDFGIPKGCLNGEQALKYIYIRYLNLYEKINFLGEDPNHNDIGGERDAPARKKQCLPRYGVPLSYNYEQHKIADTLRPGFNMSTEMVEFSEYDKLEKALLSGLPNEVDFVINVCTLLSNESKHTLRLDKSRHLLDLLLGHIGVFHEGASSLEPLYEGGWRQQSSRDFIRFWFDTIRDEKARKMISSTRTDPYNCLPGEEVLHLNREMGINDKEGIRITQLAIILRNLSFDEDNMKYLASSDLVFRFLLLCVYCSYGTLRQLSLDTLGNLASGITLEPVDSFVSRNTLELLVKCLMSPDKFAVVRGLEMLSKLSQIDENEFVLSEKLDSTIYEEITKFLTVQDIQLIVSSLEALYQLSELGEATTTKIAEVSNSIDTLVSLITVEAQSYGPNSLVGIKVVEYCPPPHLAGGATEGTPGAPGPPPAPAQPPGTQQALKNKSQPAVSTAMQVADGKTPAVQTSNQSSDMETATCNWLQATYELLEGGMVPQLGLYSEYLSFCKKFSLQQALTAQSFFTTVNVVFPKVETVSSVKDGGGSREMCVRGLSKRAQPQPFSIPCQVDSRAHSVAPISQSFPMRPSNSLPPNSSVTHAPMLLQRLSEPVRNQHQISPSLFHSGGTAIQVTPGQNTMAPRGGTTPQGTHIYTGTVSATGSMLSPSLGQKSSSKNQSKKAGITSKKPQPILPRQSGQFPVIMPKTVGSTTPQMTTIQSNTVPLGQEIVYQTVIEGGNESTETKMVKTLLAKKLRQGNPVGFQGNINYGEVMMTVDNTAVRQPDDQIQVQYQTSGVFSQPQPVQQATFIQYTQPVEGLQPNVQAIVNPNQTSTVQTFVMQPGLIVQQNFQPSSSLQPTVIPQHPTLPVSSPVISSTTMNSSETVEKPAKSKKGASHNNPPHSTQPSSPDSSLLVEDGLSPASPHQLELEVCGEVEQAKDVIQGQEARIERVENRCVQEHYQTLNNENKPSIVEDSGENVRDCKVVVTSSVDSTLEDDCAVQTVIDSAEIENAIGSIMETADDVEDNDPEPGTISLRDAISTCIGEQEDEEEEAGEVLLNVEQESATLEYIQPCANSEISKPMSPEEEPVMIENDGNELLFEAGYKCVKEPGPLLNGGEAVIDTLETNENYVESESAVDQIMTDVSNPELENVEQDLNGPSREDEAIQEDMTSVAVLVQSEGLMTETEDSCQVELAVAEGDVIQLETHSNVLEEQAEEQVEEELEETRAPVEVLPPQPTVIPQPLQVAENGLYEQDLEARMAVENLLKDVEFNVNGDDTCSEEDVAVYSCPQQDNSVSVQMEESNDNEDSNTQLESKTTHESQTVSSQSINKSSASLKHTSSSNSLSNSSSSANHVSQNGIVTSSVHDSKPLVNGNLSSPEYCQSDIVPSPVYSDRGDDTKLVNGIDDCKVFSNKTIDKVSKLNGVVNHKFNKSPVLEVYQAQAEEKMEVESPGIESKTQGDILAQSILVNGIQPSDGDIPDTEPIIPVVKQLPANAIIGNIVTVNCLQMSVQGNLNNCNSANSLSAVSVSNCIAFTNNALIGSKVQFPGSGICNSRHIPTPESSRDSELSCDSTTSTSTVTTDLNIIIPDKHSMSFISTPKVASKDSSKSSLENRTKSGDGKATGSKSNERKPKKRSRSKSGGSGGDSRPSSTPSSGPSTPAPVIPELMCEWSQCKKCFDNVRSVFCHVCTVHLKVETDGLCKWDGCEALVRKRWSLFTHVQDHHCSEGALRAAAQRRVQALQSGQAVSNPAIPAMVYPPDAAVQAIRRFIPKPPYSEFMEGREGPVTKHIRLTAALILRNLARYSAAGRSLIKKHERQIGYSCMSAVESSTALANCLFEILNER